MVIYFGNILWLYTLVIYVGNILWLYTLVLYFGYILWLYTTLGSYPNPLCRQLDKPVIHPKPIYDSLNTISQDIYVVTTVYLHLHYILYTTSLLFVDNAVCTKHYLLIIICQSHHQTSKQPIVLVMSVYVMSRRSYILFRRRCSNNASANIFTCNTIVALSQQLTRTI